MSSTATPDQRSARRTQIGFVSSRSGDKSVKVTVAYKKPHPLYQKVVNRQTVLHVHDEKNETKVGDKVEVMETRRLSRLKRWRVVSIVQKGVTTDAVAISETDVAALVPTKTTKVETPASRVETPAKPAATAPKA
jgi:small subunit ribosomal protein S17